MGEALGEIPGWQLGSVERQHEDYLTASFVRQRAEDSLDLARRQASRSASGWAYTLGDGHTISFDANHCCWVFVIARATRAHATPPVVELADERTDSAGSM